MFDIELKNSNEMTIRAKEKVVNINVAQSKIDAGLAVGELEGAGEYEIGDIVVSATDTKAKGHGSHGAMGRRMGVATDYGHARQ